MMTKEVADPVRNRINSDLAGSVDKFDLYGVSVIEFHVTYFDRAGRVAFWLHRVRLYNEDGLTRVVEVTLRRE